jgi:hypothetical protein
LITPEELIASRFSTDELTILFFSLQHRTTPDISEKMFNLTPIPSEPAEAYSALSRYLALGPKRSVKALAGELEISICRIRRWFRKFNWARRASAYDLAVVQEEQRLQHEQLELRAVDWAIRREQIREEEWQASRKLIKRFREGLDNPRIPMSFRDMLKMLDAACTLSRRAAGANWSDVSAERPSFQHQVESALRRAYGPPEKETQLPRHN